MLIWFQGQGRRSWSNETRSFTMHSSYGVQATCNPRAPCHPELLGLGRSLLDLNQLGQPQVKTWALPCSSYPWFSSCHPWEQHGHRLLHHGPEQLCPRPPWDHSSALPGRSPGSAIRVCKRRGFFISGPSVPSCKLDECPRVTQPCSGSPVSGFLLAWAHFY